MLITHHYHIPPSSHPSISSHTTLLCNTHPASRTHRYDTCQLQGVKEKDRAGHTRYARSFFFFSFFTNYVHDSATPTPSHLLLADTPHPVHQAHTPHLAPHIRHLPRPAPHDKHVKRAHWGMFYVLVVNITPSAYTSLLALANTNMKNTSSGTCSLCSAATSSRPPRQTRKTCPQGVFFVFVIFLILPLMTNT